MKQRFRISCLSLCENSSMKDFGFDKTWDRTGTYSFKYDRRKELFGHEDILPMWVADMDLPVSPAIQNALKERTEHPIFGYTMRPEIYYESIRNWVSERYHWDIGTEWIQFSPGVVPALNMLVQQFTKPGDAVILQSPVYHPFFYAIRNNNRKLLNNQLIEQDGRYTIDFDHLADIAKEAKMLLFCHPHNPVGRSWRREELIKLGEICLEHNVLIVSDEIHADLTLPGYRHIPLASVLPGLEEITFTCIAPSKTFNLAGLSTSSVIISNEKLRKRFSLFLERLHLNMGNLFGTTASIAAYTHGAEWLEATLDYIANNIKYVDTFLNEEIRDISKSPTEATYLLWLDFRKLNLDPESLNRFVIEDAGLGLNDGPMFGPGGEGFQRMNIACSQETVIQAMDRLKKALNSRK